MVFKERKISLLKFLASAFIAALIYVANGGPLDGGFLRTQSVFFSLSFIAGVFSKKIRLTLLILGLVGIVIMFPFYVYVENINIVDNIGSTGFGLLFIAVVLYLPELARKGNILQIKKWLIKDDER